MSAAEQPLSADDAALLEALFGPMPPSREDYERAAEAVLGGEE